MRVLGLPLQRPIATGALYATLLLAGLASLQRLPIALSPELEFPLLAVQFTWPNASPEMMESLVTSRVEAELNQLPHVHEVSSVSGRGFSGINLAYERGTAMDRAELLLRDRLASIRETLPRDVQPPEVQRWQPAGEAREEFMVLQAAGEQTAEALRDLLDQRLLPAVLTVPGVSRAEVYGGSPREIRVELDPEAVESGRVSLLRVEAALLRLTSPASLGAVRRDGWRIPVVANRETPSAASFRAAIVGGTPERPVRLGEVARVVDTWQEPLRMARLNGRPTVQVVLERETATNLIAVAREARAAIDATRSQLPPDVTLTLVHDASKSIRKEISVLSQRAAWSLVLIFLVLVVTSRRIRSSAAVLSTVVFSALGTFVLFRVIGLGIDLVTLSGLALAFGMAVDNAIVILENIGIRARGHRSLRSLRTLAATREVLFPLLAGTLTTAVVLMPFLYLTGDLRDYYLPFVFAVCLSLVASLVVALTLTPLIARWAMGAPPRGQRLPHRVQRVLEAAYTACAHLLTATLETLLRWRWVTVGAAIVVFAGSVWVFQNKVSTGSIFPPQTDTTVAVSVGLAPGAEIAQTNSLVSEFEQILLQHDFYRKGYIDQVEARVGENRGMVIARFVPGVANTPVATLLKEELVERAALISGANIGVSGQGPGYYSGGGSVSADYSLRLRGPDYLELAEISQQLARRLERQGRIDKVNPNASSWIAKDAMEFVATPDRPALAQLGMSLRDLDRVLQPAVAGQIADRRISTPEGESRASLRYAGGNALTEVSLAGLGVRTAQGVAFPMGDVLTVEQRAVQGEIHRRNQEYERVIGFEFRGPRRVGNRYVKAFLEGTELPPGYSMEDGLGVFLTSKDERQIRNALLLAFLLIYMVSAALFESLVLPFVAILAVPLSFSGIALVFWATGNTFDRTAYIGLILLAGIAINNALLLVHRAGALQQRWHDGRRAAARAASERFRPIVLTTATSLAGLAPLAFGNDPTSAASWASLALSASAGLLTSAVVTLGVIPPLFSLLVRDRVSPVAIPNHAPSRAVR